MQQYARSLRRIPRAGSEATVAEDATTAELLNTQAVAAKAASTANVALGNSVSNKALGKKKTQQNPRNRKWI